MEKIGTAGNHGTGTKSDCFVRFEQTDSGGRNIELKSKVKALFGNKILKLVNDILDFYSIDNCNLSIEDTGALDFVLAARIEAAIRKVIDTDKEYLLPILEGNVNSTPRDTFRFSRLYLPGNTPKLMLNAGLHKPNGLILDLEDAVAPDKKYEARFIVRNALRNLNFYGAERMVRINQIPDGLDDLEFLVKHNVNLVLVPKSENADDLVKVENKINELKAKYSIANDIWLMPIIESAKGVINAYEIASAVKSVVAVAIGLEDYTADLGVMRTDGGDESYVARNLVVIACKAAGVQAIDSVFSDVSDMEALAENVKRSKSIGFDGMGCIHPRQIKVIHDNFAPEEKQVEKAKKIVAAFKDATAKGLGVVSLGTKMIDPPVVKRAERTIELAVSLGIIGENWYEQMMEEQNN